MRKIILPVALAAAITMAGCTSLPVGMSGQYPSSADVYTPDQAQVAQRVQLGTVLSVRRVTIAASNTREGTGSALGAALGGLLGHQVGDGNGKTVATVAGAIAGAIGGAKATQHAYRQPGYTITVKLDSGGGVINVTQAADVPIRKGMRVQVIGGSYGTARVMPLASAH